MGALMEQPRGDLRSQSRQTRKKFQPVNAHSTHIGPYPFESVFPTALFSNSQFSPFCSSSACSKQPSPPPSRSSWNPPADPIHRSDKTRAWSKSMAECPCSPLPSAKPKNKNGLGGWSAGRIPGELEELGISAVTVNVMPHSLIRLKPEPDTEPPTGMDPNSRLTC